MPVRTMDDIRKEREATGGTGLGGGIAPATNPCSGGGGGGSGAAGGNYTTAGGYTPIPDYWCVVVRWCVTGCGPRERCHRANEGDQGDGQGGGFGFWFRVTAPSRANLAPLCPSHAERQRTHGSAYCDRRRMRTVASVTCKITTTTAGSILF